MTVQALDTRSSVQASETSQGVLRRYPQFNISPAILLALLGAWWLANPVLGAPTYVRPPLEDVLRAMACGLSRSPWDEAVYWDHAGITVWEAVLGFAIGSVLGALLGLVLSHWPILGQSWYPYIVGFQSLPKVALAQLMVVWVESQPVQSRVQHYKVIDPALGVIERGTWNVADTVAEQPWLPNGPIPLDVNWTRASGAEQAVK